MPDRRTEGRPELETVRRRRWARWRLGAQVFFLGLFLLLTLSVWTAWHSRLPHDVFLRGDPLLWLSSSLASREVAWHAGFVLGLVLLTLLLGRLFCGWVCPVGTVLDLTRPMPRGRAGRLFVQRWSAARFTLLMGMVGAAVLGLNLAGWVDPLAIITRALHAGRSMPALDWPALVAVALLVGVIGLTRVAPRFWCRVLCPLGALFSWLARAARYRRGVSRKCASCGACSTVCPMEVSGASGPSGECLLCGRCAALCPHDAVRLAWQPIPVIRQEYQRPTLDRSRRTLLLGLGGLATGAALGMGSRQALEADALRPPGAGPDDKFGARCIGCGACVAVCPTGGLVQRLRWERLEAGLSPEFVPRTGPCLPSCNACGEVCPTGAIPRLNLEQKRSSRMGVAVIDPARCPPWAGGERCVICLDTCPPEFRAIELRRGDQGGFRPYIIESRCPGCGLCEHRCPVEGRAAIRVRPLPRG